MMPVSQNICMPFLAILSTYLGWHLEDARHAGGVATPTAVHSADAPLPAYKHVESESSGTVVRPCTVVVLRWRVDTP